MQLPVSVTSLYDAPGPFATVYLDASHTTERGAAEVELRWRGLRGELEQAGADAATLEALDAVAGGHLNVPGQRGQVLVARGGEVRLDVITDRPPLREQARWSPLPHLMPFLAAHMLRIPYMLVRIDRTGADLATYIDEQAHEEHTVEGSQRYPLHKTGRDTWDERHFQNRVDNAWETNAADVAHDIAKHLPTAVKLVLVAGDPRARSMVIEHLTAALPQNVAIRHVEGGGRGEGSSLEVLHAEVRDALLQEVWRDRRDVLERLQRAVGRQDYAATGVSAVIDALRKAQVDTLVLADEPESTLQAWIGPGALDLALSREDLVATGVEDPQQDRLDAALVRALAGSGGTVLVMPGGHEIMADGIGALLRYTDASTEH